MYNRVEGFSTFFDCWKPTHFCWLGIFLWTQFQKICNFGRVSWATHARQSFNFQNITRTLKINIFLKTCEHFPNTSKNNLQKENLQKKLVYYSFLFSKNGLNCFWSVQGQTNFFLNFTSFLALKKIKEYVPPPVAGFKKVIKSFLLIFG